MKVQEIKLSNIDTEGCIEVHIKVDDAWFRLIKEVEGGSIHHFADPERLMKSGSLEKVED